MPLDMNDAHRELRRTDIEAHTLYDWELLLYRLLKYRWQNDAWSVYTWSPEHVSKLTVSIGLYQVLLILTTLPMIIVVSENALLMLLYSLLIRGL